MRKPSERQRIGRRRSRSMDAAKRRERDRIRAMSPRERIYLALRLGRQMARFARCDADE
jgi:hypothetical protein